MAKSSIHIESGKTGFFSHNDRTRKTKNSIFSDEENYSSCSSKEAIGNFKIELEERTAAYLKNHPTRKKLHAKTFTHLSAILNLNKEHQPGDIQKVCDYLEETFDTKVIQFSIHRDEGHISDDGEKIKNYHAHIEFMGIDSKGNSVRRKLDRKALITLQTEVSELLKMERGVNYAREEAPRPKRLNTYEYKAHKQDEAKQILAKQKDLKEEIKQLREQLKEQGAKREDYAELEALNRELKEQIKSKDLTIEKLKEKKSQYFTRAVERRKEIEKIEAQIEEFDTKVPEENFSNNSTAEQVAEMFEPIYVQTLNKTKRYISKLQEENKKLEEREPEVIEVENPINTELKEQKLKLYNTVINFKTDAKTFIKKELDIDLKEDITAVQVVKYLVRKVKSLTQRLSETLQKNTELEKKNEELEKHNTKLEIKLQGQEISKMLEKNKEQDEDISYGMHP